MRGREVSVSKHVTTLDERVRLLMESDGDQMFLFQWGGDMWMHINRGYYGLHPCHNLRTNQLRWFSGEEKVTYG
jgi:hypothetical protein